MRAVLADTGPLYAAVDPDDQYHERAQDQLKALQDGRLSVVLAYSTLLEAYTLILYRLGHRTVTEWLEDVRAGAALVNPTPQDYRDATALVSRFPDQSISLFDATLASLASRVDLPVWTYDHHFDVMKTAVWR
jgi:predicted nucleic acid-binding protein